MKKIMLLSLLVASSLAHAQTGRGWAWDSQKISNNGNVSLKSSNGSTSYNAIQNPTGAVAKANQSALTQPPTVIIQATAAGGSSSSYSQAIPLLNQTATPPSCPAGYTSAYTITTTGCDLGGGGKFISNVGGTKWNLVTQAPNLGTSAIWLFDGSGSYYYNGNTFNPSGPNVTCSGATWSANLCVKP